jgi:hypothetical protein
MALALQLDANLRQPSEPGWRHFFPAPFVGQEGVAANAQSARMAWNDPEFGTIMCKPLQLQDDFLNHPAQLSSGAVLRLATDYQANAADLSSHLIWEAPFGNASNPFIFFTPATQYLAAPTLTPAGQATSSHLDDVNDWAETGSGGIFEPTPGAFPATSPLMDLRHLVQTKKRFPANQGFYFRWFFPDFGTGPHQSVFAFAFGQYLAVCRNVLMEVYRDLSPGGDRTHWGLDSKKQMFGHTSHTDLKINSDYGFGLQAPGSNAPGDRTLLVLPYRRNRILLMSNTGQRLIITVYNKPQGLPDNSDWDITRSDTVSVWALTPIAGRFQIQKLMFEPGPVTLNFPPVRMDYTPVSPPTITQYQDVFHGESLTSTLSFPSAYNMPVDPRTNDCPPPTTAGSDISRTYGVSITFSSSADQNFSPQFYGLELVSHVTFIDNPGTPLSLADQGGTSGVQTAEISYGLNPGEGHLTAECLDFNPYPAAPFYDRSEIPLQLSLNGTPVFTGYSDRCERRPLRQAGPPRQFRIRANDRWLLLQQSVLRPQKDYTGDGHITVVKSIIEQCGIDTTTFPPEFPAGWDGANAGQYNTPLGLPIYDSNNLTGEQQLGWMPQPLESGAVFLKRIAENYSGWIMGFRSTGNFFYLPYNYFTTSEVVFHAYHGGVMSGLMPTAAAGLSVAISAGTAVVSGGGPTVSPGSQTLSSLADNSVNTLFLNSNGVAGSNTTGVIPAGAVGLGTATTQSGSVISVDTGMASGRQMATAPTFRSPVEHRVIEPSGNYVQVYTWYSVDYTANVSAPFIDWASIKNPNAPNYLGHVKMFPYQINGAFSCAQLNAMARIIFQAARRRRKRVSFVADFQSGLELGHVFTLEGIGNYRLLEMRAHYRRSGWEPAEYVGESTENGF